MGDGGWKSERERLRYVPGSGSSNPHRLPGGAGRGSAAVPHFLIIRRATSRKLAAVIGANRQIRPASCRGLSAEDGRWARSIARHDRTRFRGNFRYSSHLDANTGPGALVKLRIRGQAQSGRDKTNHADSLGKIRALSRKGWRVPAGLKR